MFDKRLLANFDWVFFLLVLLITLMGVAAIYSASKGYADDTPYWIRQLFWLAAGLGVAFVLLLFDLRAISGWAYVIHALVLLSLFLLWSHGSGAGTTSVNRWFVVGPVAIQPSEFVKLSMVLAIAHCFRDNRRVVGWYGNLWVLLIMLIPFFLIVQQPDLGTALLLVLVYLPMVLLAGLRWRVVFLMGIGGMLAIVVLVGAFMFGYYTIDGKVSTQLRREGAAARLLSQLEPLEGERFYRLTSLQHRLAEQAPALSPEEMAQIAKKAHRPYISVLLRPYQQKRLITFVNPDHDPLGAGYHVIQSKVAVGSGGFWGKGYGNSTQGALNFLPARHTDFLFAVFAEEWGFFGAAGLLGLYAALIMRVFSIMLQTHDRFSSFLLMGVIAIMSAQIMINIGMALGLLPVVGVPLPLFSYGGSSMITTMIGVGLILNIRMRRFLWS